MGAYPVKFGKYLLLERVNVGGMAEVFKAKTFGVAGFERILAIKRILPSLVEDDEFIRMFIDEARIAVQLNHANIVQIYELGKHGEHYYIAMEYLPSRDLRSILDRLRAAGQLMPIAQAAFVTSKVCEGLDYAHRRRDPSGEPMNIVHRDVSPQNILITFEGDIKVIDFGIAKAANRASKTQAGVLKGKFGYMSPEQVRGLPIDRRSDIFAVGVLLYEMLTGERLFIGESDFSTLERVRNAEVIPPTTFNKKITPELEQIVLKALAREAEDRYQWASDLAEDLQSFLIEDRSIYNQKRLGTYMKEMYAAEIAAERAKMEEYLSLAMEGASSELPDRAAVEALPSPYVEVKPHSVETNTDPLRGEADDGIDFHLDDADDFEEDKTFVIEASEAGKALQKSIPDGDPSRRPPRMPDHTDDDFLAGASLYGEDASDVEDDAATMVSVSNPFDENHGPGTDDGGEPNGGQTLASYPEAGPSSETNVLELGGTDPHAPLPSMVGPTYDDEGAAGGAGASLMSGASGPMPADPDAPTRAAPSEGFDFAGVQLPVGAPHLPPPPGPPATPQQDPADFTERAPRAPEPAPPALSRGALIGLIAGVAVTFLVFAGVAIGVIVKLVGTDTVPIVLAPPDPTSPPSAVKVFIDGALVAETLPAQVMLSEAPGQLLRVEASGYAPLELLLPQVNASLSPLTLPLQKLDDGTAASDVAPKEAAKEAPKREAPKGEDPKAGTASDGAVEAGEKRAPAEVASADGEGEKAPADEPKPAETKLAVAATVVQDPWRVSFTTIADGAPVHGARVLRDGVVVGRTPLELELPGSVERVTLEVQAEGFAVKQLNLARAGRAQVGPGSVRLERPAPGASAVAQGGAEGKAAPEEPAKAAAAAGEEAKGEATAAKPEEESPKADEQAADAKATAAKETPEAKADAEKRPSQERAQAAAERGAAKEAPKERRQQPRQARKAAEKRVELALGTRPFAQVIVNGRKLSQTTPLMGARALKLRPGDHIIQFIDTKTNKRYRYKVTLPADSPKNKLIIILGGDIRVREGKVKAVELR